MSLDRRDFIKRLLSGVIASTIDPTPLVNAILAETADVADDKWEDYVIHLTLHFNLLCNNPSRIAYISGITGGEDEV